MELQEFEERSQKERENETRNVFQGQKRLQPELVQKKTRHEVDEQQQQSQQQQQQQQQSQQQQQQQQQSQQQQQQQQDGQKQVQKETEQKQNIETDEEKRNEIEQRTSEKQLLQPECEEKKTRHEIKKLQQDEQKQQEQEKKQQGRVQKQRPNKKRQANKPRIVKTRQKPERIKRISTQEERGKSTVNRVLSTAPSDGFIVAQETNRYLRYNLMQNLGEESMFEALGVREGKGKPIHVIRTRYHYRTIDP